MPSVSIDVDYQKLDEQRNIQERSSVLEERRNADASVVDAIELLDQTYERARTRLIDSLSETAAEQVPIMVPVPEYALARVQAALARTSIAGDSPGASTTEVIDR